MFNLSYPSFFGTADMQAREQTGFIFINEIFFDTLILHKCYSKMSHSIESSYKLTKG